MTIWKFPFEITDTQVISMPEGANILTVQVQNGEPCIWAIVNESAKLISRKIRVAGTGHTLPQMEVNQTSLSAGLRVYIGTIQMNGGALIFHVFDEGAV